MSKIVLFTSLTLDGVMQAPGRPDEDTRGGFKHGGWATPYADEAFGRLASEGMANTGALLLGRRTYEDILPFWNEAGGPFKGMLNNTPKYVASTKLRELPWANSTLLEGDVAKAVAGLRKKAGKDILVLGSGKLAQTLMSADLVDAYVLLIHPLILGSGSRLFPAGGPTNRLKLSDTTSTKTGVVFATYGRES
ncbi:MAG: dihydrofolate reductase family protein [Mycobacteriales bacterium]